MKLKVEDYPGYNNKPDWEKKKINDAIAKRKRRLAREARTKDTS